MKRYREEGNQVRRKMENTIHLQAIQPEALTVYSECNLSMTGLCVATSIKESVKEGLR